MSATPFTSGERVGKGMSFFMTGGELGRALGPILIVSLGNGSGWRRVIPRSAAREAH